MSPIIGVMVLFLIVFTFGALLISVAAVLGPKLKNNSVAKKTAYECGFQVPDSEVSKVPVKFYLTAILFILFDIEIIFMYPWALAYGDFIEQGRGLYMFSAMFIFISIFVLGLVWEIKSRALEWE